MRYQPLKNNWKNVPCVLVQTVSEKGQMQVVSLPSAASSYCVLSLETLGFRSRRKRKHSVLNEDNGHKGAMESTRFCIEIKPRISEL